MVTVPSISCSASYEPQSLESEIERLPFISLKNATKYLQTTPPAPPETFFLYRIWPPFDPVTFACTFIDRTCQIQTDFFWHDKHTQQICLLTAEVGRYLLNDPGYLSLMDLINSRYGGIQHKLPKDRSIKIQTRHQELTAHLLPVLFDLYEREALALAPVGCFMIQDCFPQCGYVIWRKDAERISPFMADVSSEGLRADISSEGELFPSDFLFPDFQKMRQSLHLTSSLHHSSPKQFCDWMTHYPETRSAKIFRCLQRRSSSLESSKDEQLAHLVDETIRQSYARIFQIFKKLFFPLEPIEKFDFLQIAKLDQNLTNRYCDLFRRSLKDGEIQIPLDYYKALTNWIDSLSPEKKHVCNLKDYFWLAVIFGWSDCLDHVLRWPNVLKWLSYEDIQDAIEYTAIHHPECLETILPIPLLTKINWGRVLLYIASQGNIDSLMAIFNSPMLGTISQRALQFSFVAVCSLGHIDCVKSFLHSLRDQELNIEEALQEVRYQLLKHRSDPEIVRILSTLPVRELPSPPSIIKKTFSITIVRDPSPCHLTKAALPKTAPPR